MVAPASVFAKGLERVAGAARSGCFSSELSPAELGLCASLGAQPVAQVAGACAYVIGVSGVPVLGDPGYREYFGRGRRAGPLMFELRRVSSAYNDARRIALERLVEQAAQAAAHLVVGVKVSLIERELGEVQIVEYVVSGTAVRLADAPSGAAPHLTSLSMTDCWCLRQAGYEPVGLVAATAVYYASPSSITSQSLGKRWRAAPPNQELPDLSAAATNAQDICQSRMEQQAERLGGTGIIGLSLEMSHSFGVGLRQEGATSRERRAANLHLTVHGSGSVIRPVPHVGARPPRPSPRPVVWLGRGA